MIINDCFYFFCNFGLDLKFTGYVHWFSIPMAAWMMSAPRLTWLRQQTWTYCDMAFLRRNIKFFRNQTHQHSHKGLIMAEELHCNNASGCSQMSGCQRREASGRSSRTGELGGFLVVGNLKDQHQAGCRRHHHHHDYDCYIYIHIIRKIYV